jgi:hypothetical protein
VTFSCNESVKNYMSQELNSSFVNSNGASVTVFGRLQSALQISCALGLLIPSASLGTDGLPAVGSGTIVFPTATTDTIYKAFNSGGCGLGTSMAGQSAPYVVTAVTGTLFTKQMVVTVPGGNSNTIWMALTPETGSFSFMTVEDQRTNGRYVASRTMVSITNGNVTNGAQIKMEYISIGSNQNFVNSTGQQTNCYTSGQWQCSFEMHRVFIDETANKGYVLSHSGDPGTAAGGTGIPTRYVEYTAAGKPVDIGACSSSTTCAAQIAVSFGFQGQHTAAGGTFTPAGDYIGCVAVGSRDIVTDDSLACDITGTTISAATAIEGTRELFVSDAIASLYTGTTSATTFSFTGASDIFTAADTQ